ncbi:GAF domain-containing protein [Roseomonas chloroacetimidivorans]|uniref:PAS domain-containing sensor histidine kinase n=1 Tax=Roseomonas chloroacetimidivorans TaxID=1766656 RepID=UPI003C743FFA
MAERIRTFDWSATALGTIETWSSRLKLMVEFVLTSPTVSCLVCGPDRTLIYNDAAARMYGGRHPAALGRRLPDTFPEGWSTAGPLYARAFGGDVVQVTAQPLDTRVDKLGADVFDATLTPVRDDAGQIVCVHMVGREVRPRVRAQEGLRRKNAVLEAINRIFREALTARPEEELGRVCLAVAEEVTESAFSFMGEINFRTGRLDDLSVSERGWKAFTMDDPAFPLGKAPTGFRIHGIYGRVLLDGKSLIANDPASHPDRIGTPKGHPTLRSFLGVPLVHADQTIGMLGLGNREGGYRPEDLEAAEALAPAILQAFLSKRMRDKLRESEERFRQFGKASSDLLWIRNAETLRFEYLSPAFETIYGESLERVLSGNNVKQWAELMHPEDRRVALDNFRRVRRGERITHEFRIMRPSDGHVRWARSTVFPLLDEAGRIEKVGGVARDVTEEKRASERQELLVAELQHRTRNLLAVVRNIAHRSLGPSSERQAFDARLSSLGRVQGFLSRSNTWSVPLAELVRVELAAVGDGTSTRAAVSGPPVEIPGDKVQTVALALHELATNAAKYGALGQPGGRLAVTWRLEQGEDGPGRLILEWRESGVEMPAEPAERRGFGTILLEEALPYQLQAEVRREFTPNGVHCTIILPVGALQRGGEEI